jgi:hypothetical protein
VSDRVVLVTTLAGLLLMLALVTAGAVWLTTPFEPSSPDLPAGVRVAPQATPGQAADLRPVPLGPDTHRPLIASSLLIPYIDRGPR